MVDFHHNNHQHCFCYYCKSAFQWSVVNPRYGNFTTANQKKVKYL